MFGSSAKIPYYTPAGWENTYKPFSEGLRRVEGEVEVAHVAVNGSVAGPIRAREYLELMPKARVTGDVTYKIIEIHVGAIVMGRMVHDSDVRTNDKVIEFKPAQG